MKYCSVTNQALRHQLSDPINQSRKYLNLMKLARTLIIDQARFANTTRIELSSYYKIYYKVQGIHLVVNSATNVFFPNLFVNLFSIATFYGHFEEKIVNWKLVNNWWNYKKKKRIKCKIRRNLAANLKLS